MYLQNSIVVILFGLFAVGFSAVIETTEKQHKLVGDYIKCRTEKKPVKYCFRQLLRQFPAYYKKPVPEISLPRMDPYLKAKMQMNFSVLGNVEGETISYNVSFRGTTKMTTQAVTDLDDGRFLVKMKMPALRMTGRYRINGRLIGINVHADSTFFTVMNHVEIEFSFRIVSTGENTYDLEDVKLGFTVVDGRARLNNLVGDDGHYLGDTINAILSENLKGLLESTTDTWAPHYAEVFEAPIRSFLKYLPQKYALELIS